jgi:hypothetical protein
MAIPSAPALPRFLTVAAASELGLGLVLSLLFPFLIHLLPVPDDSRLGARLLPMFYAPLLAALLGRTPAAFGVAVLAPWVNWLLTGHPMPRTAFVMTIQLVVFVAALRFLLSRIGRRWFLAAPAYLLGLGASLGAALLQPALIGGRPPLAWAAGTLTMALPGVAILVGLNWLALRVFPSGPGGGPAAA